MQQRTPISPSMMGRCRRILDQLVLAVVGLEKSVFGTGLLEPVIAIVRRGSRTVLAKAMKSHPLDLEDAIDEAFESWPVADGQVALRRRTRSKQESTATISLVNLDDETRKRLHGVLLPGGCL